METLVSLVHVILFCASRLLITSFQLLSAWCVGFDRCDSSAVEESFVRRHTGVHWYAFEGMVL